MQTAIAALSGPKTKGPAPLPATQTASPALESAWTRAAANALGLGKKAGTEEVQAAFDKKFEGIGRTERPSRADLEALARFSAETAVGLAADPEVAKQESLTVYVDVGDKRFEVPIPKDAKAAGIRTDVQTAYMKLFGQEGLLTTDDKTKTAHAEVDPGTKAKKKAPHEEELATASSH